MTKASWIPQELLREFPESTTQVAIAIATSSQGEYIKRQIIIHYNIK